MHQLYVIEGTTKSYYDPRYEPRAASAEDRQRILFIRKHAQHAHRYSYVAGQSVEGLAMKQEIEQRLKPAAVGAPDSLAFEFGAVRLRRQGGETWLSVYPVWTNAQRPPPPNFDTGQRSLRLPAEKLGAVWPLIRQLDLDRYARVTDADFTPTPPDVQHSERLKVVVNGDTRVEWGRGFQTLVPELRAPLVAIERELTAWAAAQPAADPAKFRQLWLRDVEGLNGGQNVYLAANGSVIVQRVAPAQGDRGLTEQRYAWRLTAAELKTLRQTLAKHSPIGMIVPRRPGMPGELWVELTWEGENGERIVVAKWASDPQPDFNALHQLLLGYARAAEKRKPEWSGKYDHQWRPEEMKP
jgi:hypothetical protein